MAVCYNGMGLPVFSQADIQFDVNWFHFFGMCVCVGGVIWNNNGAPKIYSGKLFLPQLTAGSLISYH